jgi:hypothetical protein
MAGLDWDSAGASIGAAIVTIREMVSGNTKVEIIRERMGVVADRLEMAKDQLSYQRDVLAREEARSAKLEAELVEARAENRALQLQVDSFNKQAIPETFVERKGLWFKRMADGGWSENAHCPNCRSVLVRAYQGLACPKKHCGWAKVTGAAAIPGILAELRAQDAIPNKTASGYDPFAES